MHLASPIPAWVSAFVVAVSQYLPPHVPSPSLISPSACMSPLSPLLRIFHRFLQLGLHLLLQFSLPSSVAAAPPLLVLPVHCIPPPLSLFSPLRQPATTLKTTPHYVSHDPTSSSHISDLGHTEGWLHHSPDFSLLWVCVASVAWGNRAPSSVVPVRCISPPRSLFPPLPQPATK